MLRAPTSAPGRRVCAVGHCPRGLMINSSSEATSKPPPSSQNEPKKQQHGPVKVAGKPAFRRGKWGAEVRLKAYDGATTTRDDVARSFAPPAAELTALSSSPLLLLLHPAPTQETAYATYLIK